MKPSKETIIHTSRKSLWICIALYSCCAGLLTWLCWIYISTFIERGTTPTIMDYIVSLLFIGAVYLFIHITVNIFMSRNNYIRITKDGIQLNTCTNLLTRHKPLDFVEWQQVEYYSIKYKTSPYVRLRCLIIKTKGNKKAYSYSLGNIYEPCNNISELLKYYDSRKQ